MKRKPFAKQFEKMQIFRLNVCMMQFTDMVVQLVIKQNCIVMSVEKTIRINATKGIKTVRTSGQTSLRGMSIFL